MCVLVSLFPSVSDSVAHALHLKPKQATPASACCHAACVGACLQQTTLCQDVSFKCVCAVLGWPPAFTSSKSRCRGRRSGKHKSGKPSLLQVQRQSLHGLLRSPTLSSREVHRA